MCNTDFQANIKHIEFKSILQNRVATLGFAELFENKRVIVFSVTQLVGIQCYHQFMKFKNDYAELLQHNIDNIYAISSFDPLVGPWADNLFANIKGIYDGSQEFISTVVSHYNIDNDISVLSSLWRYAIIIDNGIPVKLFQTPLKRNFSWHVYKHPRYHYSGCTTEIIKKYLIDNQLVT